MKKHPPGRCLNQSCRACWAARREEAPPVDRGITIKKREPPEWAVYDRMLMSRLSRQLVYTYTRMDEPPGMPERWDPTYCWICGGPCFVLAAWRATQRSEFDNGRVIDGEVVHHQPALEGS